MQHDCYVWQEIVVVQLIISNYNIDILNAQVNVTYTHAH